MKRQDSIEFLLGGVATCCAGFFTNPLEVVKTRMQLQGELQARGFHKVHYRHVFEAFFTIARTDGLLALQSGLVPALWYQLFMNGCRLGSYQVFVNLRLTKDSQDRLSFPRTILAGAVAGCIGAVIGSPFYLIAVGYQHSHDTMFQGFGGIYKDYGVLGLWRGVSSAVPRVMIGSSIQLSTFSTTKERIMQTGIFSQDSWLNALLASMCSAVFITCFMTPFDVVSTRFYNQGIDSSGRGILYTNVVDCFSKIFKSEGFLGFYKGWVPSFFRLGPHTVLSLVFWNEIRKNYFKFFGE